MRITRWTGALLLTLGAVACRDSQSPTAPVRDLPPLAPLATEESGGVAFDHFVADATSHEWANSYLLSLLSHYAYVSLVGRRTMPASWRHSKRISRLLDSAASG